jgi:hypothetical protein
MLSIAQIRYPYKRRLLVVRAHCSTAPAALHTGKYHYGKTRSSEKRVAVPETLLQ